MNARLLFTLALLAAFALGVVESTAVFATRSHPDVWQRLDCRDRARFADVKKIAFSLSDDACIKSGNKSTALVRVRYASHGLRNRYDRERGRSARVVCETTSRFYAKAGDLKCRFAKERLSASGIYYPAYPASFSLSFSNPDQTLKSMKVTLVLDFEEGFAKGGGVLICVGAVFAFAGVAISCAMDLFLIKEIGNMLRFKSSRVWLSLGSAVCTAFVVVLSFGILVDMRLWPATKDEIYPLICTIVFILLPFHPCISVPLVYMIVQTLECNRILCGAKPDQVLFEDEENEESIYDQIPPLERDDDDAGSNEESDSDDDDEQ